MNFVYLVLLLLLTMDAQSMQDTTHAKPSFFASCFSCSRAQKYSKTQERKQIQAKKHLYRPRRVPTAFYISLLYGDPKEPFEAAPVLKVGLETIEEEDEKEC